MIISEKQIMQLISYSNICAILLIHHDPEAGKILTELLSDINEQQSEELKEIK